MTTSHMYISNIDGSFSHFEWNEDKNKTNLEKHGVSFRNAVEPFFDLNALIIEDPDHSWEEERYIILGLDESSRLLVVVFCEREEGMSVRIISARAASKSEEDQYWRKHHA